MICHSPECGQEIAAGDRQVAVALTVNWGDEDLRADHAKTVVFHSFGCLSDWAAERAADHDGHVLKEGE